MEIKSLQIISDYELCCAWQRAFVDYGMSATNENLLAMFHRRGYCAEVSFGAFTDKEEFVSMTLNGLGYFDGIYSAYDTSTGTAIEFRKQGLAKRIFQHMQSALRDRGVKQYVLEVLKNNEAAKALYTKIGFTISREFFYFRQTVATVQSALQSKDEAIQTADKIIQIEEISLPALQSISHMWDFQPSWQNSHESMQRSAHTLKVLGAFQDSNLVGYGIFEPGTGDIPQVAVAPAMRRTGIASALLAQLLLRYPPVVEYVKVINVPVDCASMVGWLGKCALVNAGGQYEMRLPL